MLCGFSSISTLFVDLLLLAVSAAAWATRSEPACAVAGYLLLLWGDQK